MKAKLTIGRSSLNIKPTLFLRRISPHAHALEPRLPSEKFAIIPNKENQNMQEERDDCSVVSKEPQKGEGRGASGFFPGLVSIKEGDRRVSRSKTSLRLHALGGKRRLGSGRWRWRA